MNPCAGTAVGEDGGTKGSLHRGDGGKDEGDVCSHLRWRLCVEDLRFLQEETGCYSWTCTSYVLTW